MKKFLCSLLAVLFVAGFAFIFVACEANYGAISGTYYLASVTYQNGTTKTADELKNNGTIANKEQEYIKLGAEKTFDVSGIISTAIGEDMGTIEVQDNVITFKEEAGYVLGTLDSSTITINISGTTYIFVKA